MKLIIDHSNPKPLYVQIEEQFRIAIQKREIDCGSKLPGEVELAEELGVARSTIRQAINNLVRDGLLIRKKSMGTFVQKAPVSSKAASWLSFSQEMAQLGIKVRNYELHVSWNQAPEEVEALFGVEPGTKLLKLERLRGSEETPFVHFISYFNPCVGMTGNEDFSAPLYEILEKQYGCIAKKSLEEISAVSADEVLSQKLEIPEGNPVLKRKRRVYDTTGIPIEWNVGFYTAERFIYSVESDREL